MPILAGGDDATLSSGVRDENCPRPGVAHQQLNHRLAVLRKTAGRDRFSELFAELLDGIIADDT